MPLTGHCERYLYQTALNQHSSACTCCSEGRPQPWCTQQQTVRSSINAFSQHWLVQHRSLSWPPNDLNEAHPDQFIQIQVLPSMLTLIVSVASRMPFTPQTAPVSWLQWACCSAIPRPHFGWDCCRSRVSCRSRRGVCVRRLVRFVPTWMSSVGKVTRLCPVSRHLRLVWDQLSTSEVAVLLARWVNVEENNTHTPENNPKQNTDMFFETTLQKKSVKMALLQLANDNQMRDTWHEKTKSCFVEGCHHRRHRWLSKGWWGEAAAEVILKKRPPQAEVVCH